MSRRRLSDDERTLWKGVVRSIKPLRKAPEADAVPAEPAATPPAKIPKRAAAPPSSPVRAKDKDGSPSAKPSSPPLAPLGRRMKKRVARGAHAIDGRLDLHGLTQAEAHNALFGFLRQTQARGGRLVLVITGKGIAGRGGDDATAERGVLKRQVPMWLRLPEFRGMVVGFESAGAGHGGEGALYVRLRRSAQT